GGPSGDDPGGLGQDPRRGQRGGQARDEEGPGAQDADQWRQQHRGGGVQREDDRQQHRARYRRRRWKGWGASPPAGATDGRALSRLAALRPSALTARRMSVPCPHIFPRYGSVTIGNSTGLPGITPPEPPGPPSSFPFEAWLFSPDPSPPFPGPRTRPLRAGSGRTSRRVVGLDAARLRTNAASAPYRSY